ncbi:hypothetical protein [Microvirga sp. CF3016]|uniref:hypothetical protein n=1 Tax=Microvirga sp. CF3016 TaxID=3110181 RepID=UPI002E7681A1|nr:hypothetical protein [Microvirga sp. CF3016]MEE1613557.1 hypothetical protein [Microvirga sp. CF3016]
MIVHHDDQWSAADLTDDEGADRAGMDLGPETSPAEEIAHGFGAFGQISCPRAHRWNGNEAPEVRLCPHQAFVREHRERFLRQAMTGEE